MRLWLPRVLPASAALLTLLVFTTLPATAQTVEPQTPPAQTPPPSSGIHYGVRFGPSFTSLTSVEAFDETATPAAFEPTLNFGGYLVVPLTGSLSFQPEVLFAAIGQRIRDKDAPPITTSSGEVKDAPADRVVLIRYLEIPLLLRISRRTHDNTSVYAIGGLSFALQRNAVIREVADSGKHEDISDLVAGTNSSYVAGAGLQHKRWLVDARFSRGMRNVASDPAAVPVKTRAFSVLMGVQF
jgi:hypothetical protein